MDKLITIAVDGHGSLVALSPRSGIELARVPVRDASHAAHVLAAIEAVTLAFKDLEAQGYPNARSAFWKAQQP